MAITKKVSASRLTHEVQRSSKFRCKAACLRSRFLPRTHFNRFSVRNISMRQSPAPVTPVTGDGQPDNCIPEIFKNMLEQQEVTAENSATTSYNNFIILPPPRKYQLIAALTPVKTQRKQLQAHKHSSLPKKSLLEIQVSSISSVATVWDSSLKHAHRHVNSTAFVLTELEMELHPMLDDWSQPTLFCKSSAYRVVAPVGDIQSKCQPVIVFQMLFVKVEAHQFGSVKYSLSQIVCFFTGNKLLFIKLELRNCC